MQTRLLSLAQLAKAVKRSHPFVRALADSGVVDSFVTDTGWRAFPKCAIEQARAHIEKKTREIVEA